MLLVLLFCCACALWFVRKWRLERLTASVPTLPGELPFIGHAHHIIGNLESFNEILEKHWWIDRRQRNIRDNYCNLDQLHASLFSGLWDFFESVQTKTINGKGMMKTWMGPKLCFLITDPNIAQKMLQTFDEKPYIYEFAKSWLDAGLITSDVSKWRKHRKLLNPTFSQRILDGFVEVFNEVSAQFVTKLENELGKEEFDIFPYLNDVAMENILQTAFGLKTLQKSSDEYKDAAAKMFEILCTRLQNIWMHPSFLYNWTKTKKEEDKHLKTLKKVSSDVLRTRKAELNEILSKDTKESGLSLKGFLDYLLELESEGLLTDKEVAAEVDTMIVAGSDTTSRTLLFTLILLAAHSDVQDRVYTEIQEVLGESSCDVSKNHLSKLVYMEAVIKESMRLYPIIPIVARNVTLDYKHDDFVLPSGSMIVVMFSGINRNYYWGQDVENFNPHRWSDDSLPDFASFGFGRRACIGRNYAMMSMKTTLAHFLRRYRVSRRETQIKLKFDILLKPAMGHHISIKLRQLLKR